MAAASSPLLHRISSHARVALARLLPDRPHLADSCLDTPKRGRIGTKPGTKREPATTPRRVIADSAHHREQVPAAIHCTPAGPASARRMDLTPLHGLKGEPFLRGLMELALDQYPDEEEPDGVS